MFEVEEQLKVYFESCLYKNSVELANAFTYLFGEEYRNKITNCIKNESIVFMINKHDIDTLLDMDINSEDRKLLEYFKGEFNNPKRTIIGDNLLVTYFLPNGYKDDLEAFIKRDKYGLTIYSQSRNIRKFYRQMLFSVVDGYVDEEKNCLIEELYDIRYFYDLLVHFSYSINENGNLYDPISQLNVSDEHKENIEKFFLIIRNDIASLVWNLLNEKGISIMDNKVEKTKYFSPRQRLSDNFYKYFSDLFAFILTKPNDFIKIVGEDNLNDFIEALVENQDEDLINEIIERMVDSRALNAKYEIVGVDVSTINKSKKEYESKKERIRRINSLVGRISNKRSENDPIIFNIEKDNNRIVNNIKKTEERINNIKEDYNNGNKFGL